MCTEPHLARGLFAPAVIRREPAAAPADPVTPAPVDAVSCRRPASPRRTGNRIAKSTTRQRI